MNSQCVGYHISFYFCLSLKSGHSEPGCESTEGEGEDETNAGTHQASVPKKEDFVLEEEIIDVSYFCPETY